MTTKTSDEARRLTAATTAREAADTVRRLTRTPESLAAFRRAEMEEKRARRAYKMKHG